MTPISLWAEAFSAHIPSEGAWRMPLKVLELMRQMQQQEGVEPDPVTFPRIVIEYATVATLWGRQVYSWKFTQSGLDSDIFLSTCSDHIGLYAKYGSIEDSSAWSVFHNVSITLVVSWMPCLEHFPCRGMLRKHKCPFWADVSWRWRDLSSHFWFFGLSACTSCRPNGWSPRLLWYRG